MCYIRMIYAIKSTVLVFVDLNYEISKALNKNFSYNYNSVAYTYLA